LQEEYVMKIRGTTVFLIVVVVILLVVAVIANINTFRELGWIGGPRSRQPVEEVKRTNTNNSPDEEITPPVQEEENEENSVKPENSNWRASLPRSQYGRNNPFQPLRGARSRTEPKPKPEPDEKEGPGPLMQVTAVFGGQAIIKVDGASKTVSAGDTLAEMEVVSIGEDEVLLRKEDKDYTITLGEEPKPIPPGEAE
jgi:hypothetical protein